MATLRHEGYSHPGQEKVYSKTELDSEAAVETNGASLRQIKDFKVSLYIILGSLLVDWE